MRACRSGSPEGGFAQYGVDFGRPNDLSRRMAMAGSVLEFTDGNFSTEVLSSDQPVLVDFWAPWCGPCKMIAPTVEQIAGEYAGKVRVGKVNTDENPQIAASHNISSIPTLLLFKGGEVVDQTIGVTPKQQLTAMLDKHVGTQIA
ncbi:MAG: thioredoxin [Planctomycetaceae bacterium]